MRLHRLEVAAFGPFAGRAVIDLDALGEAGLYLITGATGSGKTSLLDAVSFALFGSLPGTRDAKELKSQHAAPAETPEVVLEVTLRERRFRVRRSPAFRRPGRKTLVQASITLDERIDGTWVHLTGRLDEAGRVFEDVLGMTCDQFHRVVVLPQGQFAAFLHAKNDERGALLRQLFDVQTFADAQDWLAEEKRRAAAAADESARDLERLRHQVVRVLAGARPTDAVEPEPDRQDSWLELSPADLLAALAEAEARHRDAETVALARADQADGAQRVADQQLTAGARAADAHDRGQAARSRLAELEADGEQHDERRAALAAAEQATQVLPHQSVLEREEARLSGARAGATDAETDAGPVLAALDDAALAGWLTGHSTHGNLIEESSVAARTLAQSARDLPRLESEHRAAQEALPTLAKARAALTERLEMLAERVAAARAARDEVSGLAEQARTLAAVLTARIELDRIVEDDLPIAQDAVRDARDAEQDAREIHQTLLQRRLADMAGELAEELTDGDPCRVCGSPEHPAPAVRHDPVDDEAIEDAQAQWLRLADARGSYDAQVRVLQSRRDELLVSLADEPRDARELTATAETLGATLAERRQVAAEERALLDAQATATADLKRLETQEHELTTAVARASALLTDTRERTAATSTTLRELLRRHRDGCPCAGLSTGPGTEDLLELPAEELVTLTAATQERHHDAGVLAGRLTAARADLATAAAAHAAALTERDDALDRHDFVDIDAARAAALPPAERDALRTQVDEHVVATAAAREVLADDAVTSALGAPRPDVQALTEARDAARAAWQEAHRSLTDASLLTRQVTDLRVQAAVLVADLGPLEERRDLVTSLADLAAGRGDDNADGISLTTYVLATRLERIVALANERLSSMADARYELAVDHGRSDKRSRGGLGLRVLDQWTGEHRPTATLSGGETFMVSLALALGTADAVREESGGVDLQSLFIDEGFGSLDDAALEQVMGVLDELRAGGRAVGVISHVADMRQRIPTQLRITKTTSGSTVAVSSDVDDAA